jgi:hypothetical protein
MNTLVEFTTIVRKDMAWRVLFKATLAAIGGCVTIFTILIGPVLWVYSGIDGNRKDNARLEDQVKGLTRTVGELQITVAGVVVEVKASRNEQGRDLADIKDGIKALQQRPTPPARTATVPARRAVQ